MRRIAWGMLLLFVFTIPWEYSLDLGTPLGNVARIMGLIAMATAIPAILRRRSWRKWGPLHWLVLALFLWFSCTYFWTVDPHATLDKLRGYVQEMMIVWLVWEFAETEWDLRALLRISLAGCWVLAILTAANLASPDAIAAGQIRFTAAGQDPNDVADFSILDFPWLPCF